jgi:hypothetical protein
MAGSITITIALGGHCGETCYDQIHTLKALSWIVLILNGLALVLVAVIGTKMRSRGMKATWESQ